MFESYAYDLIKVISNDVFEEMACLFLLVFVVFIVCKGFRTGLRYSTGLLLIGYLFLLFCLTIFFRPISDTSQYDFHPFWSYKAILDGRYGLLSENIMNVVVFIPVGFLLGIAFKQMTWCKALLMGCGISVTIEALQLFLHRGFTETDDVMHNTVGCIMGYIIYSILVRIFISTKLKLDYA